MADYMSREAVLADLSAAAEKGGMGQIIADTMMRYVKRQPAADVEPVRHGRWEWDLLDIYRCSVCGEKSKVKEVMNEPVWDYCPNCGAKMDGGAEDG